jgi:O-antigen ligase
MAMLPTLAVQVVVVLGAAVVGAAGAMARAGHVLNPAWLIVAWLYLLGPLGSLLGQAGLGVPTAALVLLAPSPFVVAAVLMRPQSLERLILLVPLGLLAFLAGLSAVWSPDASYGIDKLTLWFLSGLLPATFILILASRPLSIDWRLIAGAALLYAFGVVLFGAATPLFPGRATIFGANPIWAARAVFIGALVVLFGPFPWFARLVTAPLMIGAGLMTVSLGPAVGLVVGAWAGAAEVLRCADRHVRWVAVGWAGLLFVTGVTLVVVLSGVLDPILAGVASDPNLTSRATYLGIAGKLFAQAPLVGVGIGGFASSGIDLYPHNLVAEVGSELGLAGLLILAGWLVLALRGAARSPIMVALVVATAVFSLFSGNLAGNAEFWLFSALAVSTLMIGGRPMLRPVPAALP